MKSVAFIIPGFTESPREKQYQTIGKAFKKKGITPVFVTVKWGRSTISENTKAFLNLVRETKATHITVLGFSFGALIAYRAAVEEKRIGTLLLCSLSPYFAEDLPYFKDSWKKFIGKHRLEDFQKMRNKRLAPEILAETYLFYGTKEVPLVERRVRSTYNLLRPKKHLISVEGAKHDLADKRYLQEVIQVINQL